MGCLYRISSVPGVHLALGQCTRCPAASLLQAGTAKWPAQGRRIPGAGKGPAPAAFAGLVRAQ